MAASRSCAVDHQRKPKPRASHRPPSARLWAMLELTRRRYPETREQCWRVYYGDVHAGTIASTPATRMTPSPGNGGAASIPAAGLVNAPAARLTPSTKPARISKPHGGCFCPTVSRPIFRRGATRKLGLRRNIAGLIAASECRRTGNRPERIQLLRLESRFHCGVASFRGQRVSGSDGRRE